MTTIEEYLFAEPDWNGSFVFKKRWRTSLQKSLKDDEKRSALFNWSRRILAYTLFNNNYL